MIAMHDGGVGTLGVTLDNYLWPVRTGQYDFLGHLYLYAATRELGTVFTGESSMPAQVYLKNIGTTSRTVLSSAMIGANGTEFSLTLGGSSPCTSLTPTLEAGASCTLLVTAFPTTDMSASSQEKTVIPWHGFTVS